MEGPWGPSFVHYNIINSERHKHIYWSLGESATITLTHSTGWRERVHSPPPSSLDYTFYARHVCDVWRRPQRRVQYLVFWCLLLWKAYKYKSCNTLRHMSVYAQVASIWNWEAAKVPPPNNIISISNIIKHCLHVYFVQSFNHFFAIFSLKFTMRHFFADIFHFSNIKDIIYFANKKYNTIFLLSTMITFILKGCFAARFLDNNKLHYILELFIVSSYHIRPRFHNNLALPNLQYCLRRP